ncbi:unnamed protein product [Amoebophrya sp. A120]|nr:unnamed protein product [Amoebophrya sp. A120]|eukprot:GSA120T00009619001.1
MVMSLHVQNTASATVSPGATTMRSSVLVTDHAQKKSPSQFSDEKNDDTFFLEEDLHCEEGRGSSSYNFINDHDSLREQVEEYDYPYPQMKSTSPVPVETSRSSPTASTGDEGGHKMNSGNISSTASDKAKSTFSVATIVAIWYCCGISAVLLSKEILDIQKSGVVVFCLCSHLAETCCLLLFVALTDVVPRICANWTAFGPEWRMFILGGSDSTTTDGVAHVPTSSVVKTDEQRQGHPHLLDSDRTTINNQAGASSVPKTVRRPRSTSSSSQDHRADGTTTPDNVNDHVLVRTLNTNELERDRVEEVVAAEDVEQDTTSAARGDTTTASTGTTPGRKNGTSSSTRTSPSYSKYHYFFLASGFCNAVATVSNIKGLRHLIGCQYQMFRGARVFFIGLITILVLKRRLKKRQLLGMLFTLVGIVVVSLTAMQASNENDGGTPAPGGGSSEKRAVAHSRLQEDNFNNNYAQRHEILAGGQQHYATASASVELEARPGNQNQKNKFLPKQVVRKAVEDGQQATTIDGSGHGRSADSTNEPQVISDVLSVQQQQQVDDEEHEHLQHDVVAQKSSPSSATNSIASDAPSTTKGGEAVKVPRHDDLGYSRLRDEEVPKLHSKSVSDERASVNEYRRSGVVETIFARRAAPPIIEEVSTASPPTSPGPVPVPSPSSSTSTLHGVLWCTLGAFMGSCQICLQEYIYKHAPQTPPLFSIGIEGVVGVLLVLTVIGPVFLFLIPPEKIRSTTSALSQYEIEQNVLRDLFVEENQTKIRLLFLFYMLCNAGAACLGSLVGKLLSSNGRAILESSRTIATWMVEVGMLIVAVLIAAGNSSDTTGVDHGTTATSPSTASHPATTFTSSDARSDPPPAVRTSDSSPSTATELLHEKLDVTKFLWWTEKFGFLFLLLGTALYFQLIKLEGIFENSNRCCNSRQHEEADNDRRNINEDRRREQEQHEEAADRRAFDDNLDEDDCLMFTAAEDDITTQRSRNKRELTPEMISNNSVPTLSKELRAYSTESEMVPVFPRPRASSK